MADELSNTPTAPDSVVDAKGRTITLRILDPADMLDLFEAAGSASSNAGWVRYASVVASVSGIDGVPIPIPAKKEAIRTLARRLGNDGFAAVAKFLFGDGEGAPKDDIDVGQVAKN